MASPILPFLLLALGSSPCETSAKGNAETGLLSVSSTPPFAMLLIDGKACGETPVKNLRLSAGGHSISIQDRSRPSFDTMVIVKAGGKAEIRVRLPAFHEDEDDGYPEASSYLQVKSLPPFAPVFINGRAQGETPMNAAVRVPSGKVRVEILHPAFPRYDSTFVMKPEERRSIKVRIFDGTWAK